MLAVSMKVEEISEQKWNKKDNLHYGTVLTIAKITIVVINVFNLSYVAQQSHNWSLEVLVR